MQRQRPEGCPNQPHLHGFIAHTSIKRLGYVTVPAARETCAAWGLDYSEAYIHDYVIRTSVGTLLEDAAARLKTDPAPLKAHFNALNDSRIGAIRAIPHAAETLGALRRAGHRSFVYTHRGASCRAILEQTGLAPYFTEVLTALSGFPRKPAPDAIRYLLEKYALDPAASFYVGDRSLDIEAAVNAGIGSILFLDPASPGRPTGRESYIVRDLAEIPLLFS